ncbi:MAG: hypothetical protein WCJ03_05555 [Bacteroidales bacterium]
MARVKQLDVIVGSLKNLSFYTRKGSDQVFVRTKGGATKEQIKRKPEFEALRRNNKEFGGCSKMSKEIRNTFQPLVHVADYNLAPAICSLVKDIQKRDTESAVGERAIRLSAVRYVVAGFDFNRGVRFDSLLRVPLRWSLRREELCATLEVPAFACSFGLNLPPDIRYSLFRISASLGIATDQCINASKTGYGQTHPSVGGIHRAVSTEWYSTQASLPDVQLSLDLSQGAPEFCDDDTLILSIAVEFGTLDAFGNPTPVRGVGAGKVLGVG